MNNFGNLIASRRKELKMTQKELALKLNVSDKTISKWETGASYPEITMLSTIAKVLEISINDLFGLEDMREKKIDIEEHESYDHNVINKYKNRTFITMALTIVGYILMLTVGLIENGDVQYVIFTLGLVLEVASLINFASNNISFRSFYTNKFFTRKYDYTFFNYSVTAIILFVSFFVLVPIFSSDIPIIRSSNTESVFIFFPFNESPLKAKLSYTVIGGLYFFSVILVIFSYVSIIKIARISNFSIKKDLTNKILILIAVLSAVAFFTLGSIFLILFYVLIYTLIFRKVYINNK